MKKVCIVYPPFAKYPNKCYGAVEILVTIIGEENNKQKKIDLTVISANSDEKGTVKLNIVDKILILLYRFFKKVLKLNFFCLNRYYYKVLKKIVKENYDYVIFEAGQVSNYEIFSKKIGKEKMICHVHQDIVEQDNNTKGLSEIYGKFIGVSNFIVNRLQKVYNLEAKNVKVLLNCTTEDDFCEISEQERSFLRQKLTIKQDDFVVLFVGRLLEIKGIYQLIQAIESIHENKIKLLILGSTYSKKDRETEFSKKMKDLIKDFEENIIFTGHVSHEEIYKYYQIANIQVIPTICEEAAGLVAIEGMLCGLPIVATKSGGMIEYIDDKCAKIIEKDEKIIENLKESILELYNDCEKRKMMSEHATNRAKKFTMQKYYDDFVKIMEEWERK